MNAKNYHMIIRRQTVSLPSSPMDNSRNHICSHGRYQVKNVCLKIAFSLHAYLASASP